MNIWKTPECDAWSRDFDYENYLSLFSKYKMETSPVSHFSYVTLCDVFDYEMERDMEA